MKKLLALLLTLVLCLSLCACGGPKPIRSSDTLFEVVARYSDCSILRNKETNVLLLDEPTNHLDVDAKDELKRALSVYKGSIVLICHEPDFYEGFATKVIDCSNWSTKL